MVRVIKAGEGRRLTLPGRTSREIASGTTVTVRHVEIQPHKAGHAKRGPHVHHGFEECIYVLAGEGMMESETGEHAVKAGDTILVPANELHVTHNAGSGTLSLICFFPVADVASGTKEFRSWAEAKGTP